MQRDSWMTEEADIFKASSREIKKAEAEKLNAAALRMEREAAKAVKVIPNKKYEFGDRGSGWRMMKLNRNDEIAAEEGLRPEDVALERYASIEEYQEALREREFLQNSSKLESIKQKSNFRGESFKDLSFRVPEKVTRTKDVKEVAKLEIEKPNEKVKYVIKEQREPILTRNELNLLSAKIIKATLTKAKDLSTLKEEYDFQLRRTIESERAGNSSIFKPSFDEIRSLKPKSDQEKSLQEMVKEERISKSNLDNDLIKNIKYDKSYENDHDYIDDQSTQLASISKSKERDYKKQRREYRQAKDRLNELDECRFCLLDGVPSKLSVIAQGTRIYLALPQSIDMMPYHSLIIPKSHVQSSLDLDDDDWTEIRNFQKCITRMYDSIDKVPLFMEQTVDGLHTYIECFPVSNSIHLDSFQWFKVIFG